MNLLRNIAFYVAFYIGSILITSSALASYPFSLDAFRRRVRDWPSWQRKCLKWFLGIDVVLDGASVDEPVLYAIKHESFFEAIDAPRLLNTP